MITNLAINNFRSVEKQKVDLAPLTFLYGNNATGKSSLFYALNVLRNVVLNPNQSLDSFFNLIFVNLGTFKQVVFKHEETKSISISVSAKINTTNFIYGVKLNPKQGEFFLELGDPYSLKLILPVTFPYPLNGNVQEALTIDNIVYNINWNGVVAQVTPVTVTEQSNKQAETITSLLNKAVQLIQGIDIVPLKRGFSKPQYGVVNVNQFPTTEDEVASMLTIDDYLDSKVSTYLEQTIDRQFRAKSQSGTSLTTLITLETASKITCDVVNDGFGVNQLVYMLAKILNKKTNILCIEEPEINLHPGIVRRLPHTLFELIADEKKQLLISTHSETLIIALLVAVAKGEITNNDVAFYLTTRSMGVTNFTRQKISDEGQVEGGLTSFMTGELEDIEAFFKAQRSKKNKKDRKKEEIVSQISSETESVETKSEFQNQTTNDQ